MLDIILKYLPNITWPQVTFFALFIVWEFMLGKQNKFIPKSTLGLVVAGIFFASKYIREKQWKVN